MYFLFLLKKIIKYTFIVFGVIGSIFFSIILLAYLSCAYVYKEKHLKTIQNETYEVSVWREPGGLGTNPDCKIYVREKGKLDWLFLDATEDTLSVEFVDSTSIKVRFYYIGWGDRIPRDSLYFNLKDKIKFLYINRLGSISGLRERYSLENLYSDKKN